MTKQMHDKNLPKVSLLVAMRNEEKYIAECVTSLIQQDYPDSSFEVYILDGQSTDTSCEIVESLIKGKENFFLVENPKRIQSAAWNSGIELSSGEILGIVSGHSILASDYISRAVETLKRTRADLVGGPVNAINTTIVGEAIAQAVSTPFGVGGARFRYTSVEEETDTVFMGLCYRNLYGQVGGFDEEMVRNQDDELSYRIAKIGAKIVCNPAIKSYYYNRSTILSLWRQYFNYGYWKVRVLQKHPRQMQPRQFVPPVFVAALLFSLVLAFLPCFSAYSVLVPLTYLIANLSYSVYSAIKPKDINATLDPWQAVLLLPVIYLILHLSYGLGFIVGLAKFANRWRDRSGLVPMFNSISN